MTKISRGLKALTGLALATGLMIAVSLTSCKKTAPDAGIEKNKQTRAAAADMKFTLDEIYAQLPQTIMHNLAGDFKMDIAHAQWIYEQDYVLVRIPVNDAVNKSYIYAAKYYNNPMGKPLVYFSQFLPERGSDMKDFSGRQMWLNLQDWNVYGVQFEHNQAIGCMQPVAINPHWEVEMMDAGLFYLDDEDRIAAKDEAQQNLIARRGGTEVGGDVLWDNGKGSGRGFFGWLGDIFIGIGKWWNGSDGQGNPGGGAPWTGGTPGSGPGDDPRYHGGGGNHHPGEGPSGGGYDSSEDPSSPDYNPPVDIWGHVDGSTWASTNGNISGPVSAGTGTMGNATVSFLAVTLDLNAQQKAWLLGHNDRAHDLKVYMLKAIPTLTFEQKKAIALKHLQMMRDNPGYLNFVNTFDQEYPTGKSVLELADYTFTPGTAKLPITNLNFYLSCFSNIPGATYKAILAVDQPSPNNRKAFVLLSDYKIDVGHTFLILEQNVNGNKTIRSIGLYPNGSTTPFNPQKPGVYNNDQEHYYDVALVNNISGSDFMSIINGIKAEPNPVYNLNNHNCTSFALYMLVNRPMTNIPWTIGSWPLGMGHNPGDLGEDVRHMVLTNYQSRLDAGVAPLNTP